MELLLLIVGWAVGWALGLELADVGIIVTIIGGLAALLFLLRVNQAQNAAAQLTAKDSVIHTWEQSAQANEERIDALEQKVSTLSNKLTEAHSEIKMLRAQLEQVERYAAPEAVRRFEAQQEVMIQILRAIQEEVSK